VLQNEILTTTTDGHSRAYCEADRMHRLIAGYMEIMVRLAASRLP